MAFTAAAMFDILATRYSGGVMAKRKESGFDFVASLSWPVAIVLGFIAFLGIQYGIGWLWASSDNPFLSGFGRIAAMGMYAPFAWLALGACCLAALVSFLNRRRRRHLLDSQTSMESLRGMDWRAFELLAGEAFRRQGYVVDETGQGGADGGKDLVLRKDGLKTIVQCKQWRSQRVGVQVVREMFGILMDEGADAVKIVALGGFTPDAALFARGKPIELVDGRALLSTVMTLQAEKAPDGPLDNPLLFTGSIAACLLAAFALSSQHSQRIAEATRAAVTPATSMTPPVVSIPAAPVVQRATTPMGTTVAAQPTGKVYKADAPMTDAELRDWEKRNREAMKILEKTTPELETAPAH
jgi:restriction system protein